MMFGGREAADGGTTVLRPERVCAASDLSAVRGTYGEPTRSARAATRPAVLVDDAPTSNDRAVTAGAAGAGADAVVGAAAPEVDARSRRSTFVTALIGLDVLAALVGVSIALHGSAVAMDLAFGLGLVALWPVLLGANGGYERGFVGVGDAEFSRVFRAFLHTTAVAVFASFLLGLHPSRTVVVPSLALLLALTCLTRYCARKVLHQRRRAGRSPLTPVLAVGDAASVVEFATLLRRDRYTGMDVVGACLVDAAPAGTATAELNALQVPVLGRVESVGAAARRFDAPTVAVLGGSVSADRLKRVAWQLEGTRAELVVSPGLTELGGRRMHVRPVAGLPLLHLDEPRFTGTRRIIKNAFDVVAAGLALVLLAPVMIVIGVVIRATSSGPALFRQTRVGRDGREFTMVKFRTMVVDAEARLAELVDRNDNDGVLFKLYDDPRVTPIGRVLRRLSIDELPQLLNVLTGSMSLVGPRPPLPDEVARYHDDARRRLLVKPGLTGLWQVSGRSNLSWEESIRLDLHYVEQWSLSLDLVVLWKTARAVLKADGAY